MSQSKAPLSLFRRLGRSVGAGTLLLVLSGACGGRTLNDGVTTNGADGGQAGTGPSGGSPPAGRGGAVTGTGNASSGGATGSGATGSGATGSGATGSGATGSGATGSGATGSGTGGRGGNANLACSAPPDSGTCDAYFPSWYHDPTTGICRPFVYGGCGGNANRYASLIDCQNACVTYEPDGYAACSTPMDCVLRAASCCGVCDGAGVTAHDFVAINQRSSSQERLRCGDTLREAPGPERDPIACAPCPDPGSEGTVRYFVADCVSGRCSVADIRNLPVTECKINADCRVRRGTSCCEECGTENLVALRTDLTFEKHFCGGQDISCPGCANLPPSAEAVCAAGRCEVGYLPPPN